MGSTYKELFKLYDFIQSGDVRLVEKFLQDSKLNINEILPCKGIGVLHLAVGIEPEETSQECTKILLRHAADPNLSNYEGITPVHIAAIWGRLENLKLLVGCGGDPSLRDFDGHSAFDYAAREQQWVVFDYLHNIEDLQEDTFETPCGYSLDLDKIIVTTDQMVAEYETIPENKTWTASCRKSEMVRNWCDKTSLTVNKLYPTIISDTFTIDTDSEPWRSINLTKNLTADLTSDFTQSHLDDSNNTYKTCLSKKITPIEISGIEKLQITSDESKDEAHSNSDLKQRFSVYENFSLPGSPNSITHKNYNSRTTLRKNQSKESSRSNTLDSSKSLFTEDCSILDRALAVVQNKTNEWLSNSKEDNMTDIKDGNTRRSSASSGVSSNLSSGSIAIASVQEEYKYEDEEKSVVLIEKRLLVSPIVLPVEDPVDDSPDSTILSVASSLPPSVDYDDSALRNELIKLGFRPGPIQPSTRTLYLKKLHALKRTPIVASSHGKTYSIELEKSLRTDDWMKNLDPYKELENKARSEFANPNKTWREGAAKTSFTYLLLDPRLTANLPAKASNQSSHVNWVTFVNSIFYVGKGKRSRPYSHLYDALKLWKLKITNTQNKKVQHILDIWTDKVGVVCLHIFQNIIPAEAFTYEAAMIDVLGVQNLKNLKSGTYYGSVESWPHKDRRMLGQYLLYKAMMIFLSEGERQLRPEDID